MKKLVLLACITAFAASCSIPAKLVNSASHSKAEATKPVAAVFADLKVSPEKISFFYIPTKTVLECGYDNVVNSAVREALAANGNADMLVAMETQVKYNNKGAIASITITGYPATYTNFRNAGDDYLKTLPVAPKEDKSGGLFGGLKLGKKR